MQKSEPSAAISTTQKGLPFKGRPFCVVGRVGKIENLIGALLGDISCAPATVWRRVNSGRTGITSCRRGAGTRKKSSSPSPLAQSDGNFPGWRSCPHTPRSGTNGHAAIIPTPHLVVRIGTHVLDLVSVFAPPTRVWDGRN